MSVIDSFSNSVIGPASLSNFSWAKNVLWGTYFGGQWLRKKLTDPQISSVSAQGYITKRKLSLDFSANGEIKLGITLHMCTFLANNRAYEFMTFSCLKY